MQKQGACEPPEVVGNGREMGEVGRVCDVGRRLCPRLTCGILTPRGGC